MEIEINKENKILYLEKEMTNFKNQIKENENNKIEIQKELFNLREEILEKNQLIENQSQIMSQLKNENEQLNLEIQRKINNQEIEKKALQNDENNRVI